MGVVPPKKALVTGGAGSLGSHLCKRLLDEGYEVKCLDNLFTGTKRNIADLLASPLDTLLAPIYELNVHFHGVVERV